MVNEGLNSLLHIIRMKSDVNGQFPYTCESQKSRETALVYCLFKCKAKFRAGYEPQHLMVGVELTVYEMLINEVKRCREVILLPSDRSSCL